MFKTTFARVFEFLANIKSALYWLALIATVSGASAAGAQERNPGHCPNKVYMLRCNYTQVFNQYIWLQPGTCGHNGNFELCPYTRDEGFFQGGTLRSYSTPVGAEVFDVGGNPVDHFDIVIQVNSNDVSFRRGPRPRREYWYASYGSYPGSCSVVLSSGVTEKKSEQCVGPRIGQTPEPPPTPWPGSGSPCDYGSGLPGRDLSLGRSINLSTLTEQQGTSCLKVGNAGRAIHVSLRYLAREQRAGDAYTGGAFQLSYSRKIEKNDGTSITTVILENGERKEYLFNANNFTALDSMNRALLTRDSTTSEYTLRYPNGEIDGYSSVGELVYTRDRVGNSINFSRSYDSNGRVQQLKILNPLTGESAEVNLADRTGYWRVVEIKENLPSSIAAPRVATLQYTNGLLTGYTDLAGRTYGYSFDNLKRLQSFTDPDGSTTQLSYVSNDSDKVKTEIMADGTTLTFNEVSNQAWDLEVVHSKSGASRTYRYLRNNLGQVTRIYVSNSTSAFYERIYGDDGQLESVYDPARRRTQYIYSAPGFVSEIRRYKDSSNFDVVRLDRNSFGELIRTTDAMGNVVSISINPQGLPTEIVQVGAGLSQSTRIDYEPVVINGRSVTIGLPTRFTLPDGTVNTQTYDGRGYPRITTFDAQGLALTEERSFDARGFLISSKDRRGFTTEYVYNNNPGVGQFGNLGIPSEVRYDIGANQIVSRFTYDSALNLTRVVENPGDANQRDKAMGYRYIAGNYVPAFSETRGQGPNGGFDRVAFEHNAFGELTKVIQQNASAQPFRTTEFKYTERGWPEATLRADGSLENQVTYSANLDGTIASIKDARGVVTRFDQYDSKGLLRKLTMGAASVTDGGTTRPAVNATMEFTYDANDRLDLVRVPSEGGALRTIANYDYDGLNRLAAVLDAAGNRTEYGYDPQRNFLRSVTSGSNNATEQQVVNFSYDKLGRITRQSVLRGSDSALNTDFLYSAPNSSDRWLRQQVIDQKGNITNYSYNNLGLLQRVTDAAGSVFSYSYNKLGHMTQTTPPVGAPTVYAVNGLGQVISSTRDGQTESWFYRPDGSVERYINLAGQSLTFGYDVLGRLTSKDYSGSASDPAGSRSDAQFGYWPNDLMRSATSKPDGTNAVTTSYTFDAANRLINRNRDGRNVDYSFNLDNTLAAISYWGRGSVNYGYGGTSANGTVRSLSLWGASGGSSYSYRSTDLLKQISRPVQNGVTSSFGYDAASRLTSITHSSSSGVLASVNFGLDLAGNRTSVTQRMAVGGSLQSSTNTYTYDRLHRLTSATLGALGPLAPAISQNFSYDAVGNRLTATVPGSTGLSALNAEDPKKMLQDHDAFGSLIASFPNGVTPKTSQVPQKTRPGIPEARGDAPAADKTR